MRILLLEDDPLLAQIMEEFLLSLGHTLTPCTNGEEAEEAIVTGNFDLLLLDIRVPRLSGLGLMRRLGEYRIRIPAIFITSLQGVAELKEAFDLGADDYIKKPFDLEELEARINRTARERGLLEDSLIKLGGGTLFSPSRMEIRMDGTGHPLTRKESAVLHYLCTHPNRTVSQDELIANLWRDDDPPTDSTIRTYIKKLRRILGRERIVTVTGIGYRFDTL